MQLIGLMLGFLVTMVMQRTRQNRQAYQWFMQAALLSHLIRITSSVGTPQLRPFSMQAIQSWLTKVSRTNPALRYPCPPRPFLTGWLPCLRPQRTMAMSAQASGVL